MSKKKHYVVWNGIRPGIYSSWEECQAQITGVKQALYKAFDTLAEAEHAYASSPRLYIGHGAKGENKKNVATRPASIIQNALAVDAACSGNPGMMEYRGVYVGTGEQLFHFGPIYGTNNIGEFLAIVHGLAYLKQRGFADMPIYSDSYNALLWIKGKKCKTKLPRDEKSEQLFQYIDRAEKWLKENSFSTVLMKWETEKWGEIPADFGRK